MTHLDIKGGQHVSHYWLTNPCSGGRQLLPSGGKDLPTYLNYLPTYLMTDSRWATTPRQWWPVPYVALQAPSRQNSSMATRTASRRTHGRYGMWTGMWAGMWAGMCMAFVCTASHRTVWHVGHACACGMHVYGCLCMGYVLCGCMVHAPAQMHLHAYPCTCTPRAHA